jgi:hypothetical protein
MINVKPTLVLLAATLVLSACASTQPKVVYTSFGKAQVAADSDVVRRYLADYEKRNPGSRARSLRERQRQPEAVARAQQVQVLVDTFPEGIELDGNNLRVKQDSPHAVLGRVSLAAPERSTLPREVLVEELQHLALEAGGNVVIMSFVGGDQESALGAVGYVLKSELSQLDPQKARSGKLPVEI